MKSNNFKQIKQEAWEFYKEWRKEKTYCPALKAEIRVSLKGWYHLLGTKSTKPRPRSDQIRRLKLLPYAKELIEKSNFVQDTREKKRRIYYALEGMIPVEEGGSKQLRKVRVVLIEDKNKNKIFLSIMDKKNNKSIGTNRRRSNKKSS